MIYVCQASLWPSIGKISESLLRFHFQVSPKQRLNKILTVWLPRPQKCLSVNSWSDYINILIVIRIGFSCSIFFWSHSTPRMSVMQDQVHGWLGDLTNVTATVYLLQGRRSEAHRKECQILWEKKNGILCSGTWYQIQSLQWRLLIYFTYWTKTLLCLKHEFWDSYLKRELLAVNPRATALRAPLALTVPAKPPHGPGPPFSSALAISPWPGDAWPHRCLRPHLLLLLNLLDGPWIWFISSSSSSSPSPVEQPHACCSPISSLSQVPPGSPVSW